MTVMTVMTVVSTTISFIFFSNNFFSFLEIFYFEKVFFDLYIITLSLTVITVITVIPKKTNRETYS
jgi:hypothetical protein